jgi:hypothetical protein
MKKYGGYTFCNFLHYTRHNQNKLCASYFNKKNLETCLRVVHLPQKEEKLKAITKMY